jgi:hypothetical protein
LAISAYWSLRWLSLEVVSSLFETREDVVWRGKLLPVNVLHILLTESQMLFNLFLDSNRSFIVYIDEVELSLSLFRSSIE